MKVYISGPISNKPNLNFEAFEQAENLLLEKGYEPINPHKLGEELKGITFLTKDDEYAAYMKIDIKSLVTDAEAIYMLNGWENSKGACIENIIANVIKLKVFYEGDI